MSTAQDSSDPVGLLLKEYCPPLDSAIVLAISLDYDSIDDAREILDSLKAETIVDEADGAGIGDVDHSDWFSNVFSDGGTNTTQTTATKSENSSDRDRSGGGNDSDTEIYPLALMFPHASKFTLKHTLQKCDGDTDRAIDELLNLKFLDSEGEGLKGVDAFSELSMVRGKGKNSKRRSRNMKPGAAMMVWEELDAATGERGGGGSSKWELIQSEISYLSARLDVPQAAVASAYHRHGTLSSTLVALIEGFGEGDVIPEDASHIETISSIASKYPRLLQPHIVGLVKLCKDDIASAFKFAEMLNRRQLHKLTVDNLPPPKDQSQNWNRNGSHNQGQGQVQGTTISPVSPISPSAANGWQIVGAPRKAALSSSPVSPMSPPKISYKTVAQGADNHFAARNEAFNKASAAYRRSKSDHLMGAVATYYADEGKYHDARLKTYNDMAAEALVNDNSSEYTLDLHGVTVPQALKIANEKVTEWWVKTSKTEHKTVIPFRIITGVGRHSKNGESRLGPAVSKMLTRGNWKIEIGTGDIRVLGVQKAVKKA